MEKRKHVKLSQTVLEMKFMKKTKEKLEQQKDDEEGQIMYSNELKHMRKSGNINFIEVSIANCRDLVEGRLSFQGMNPEIESLMKDEYGKKIEEAERRKEKDISDLEMAKGLSSLKDTVDNKFKSKKQRNSKKRKFMKPNDDYSLM